MAELIKLHDISDSLDKGFEHGYKEGLSTHIHSIDPHFRWMRGHVIIFGGIGGYGKSTMLNQLLLLRAIKEDKKFGLYSPEFSPTDFFYLDLIHAYIGKSPYSHHRQNKMNKDEFDRAKEFINKHFYYLTPQKEGDTVDDINEGFKRLIGEYGVDTVVTDPFNRINHDYSRFGGRDDRMLEEFYNKETRFAQDNMVSNVIVMHVNSTITKDDDGDFVTPTVFNIAGGQMTNNRADDIVIVHRPKRNSDPKDTTILFESVKIKKQNLCGRPDKVYLQFIPLTNRISDNGQCPYRGYDDIDKLPF